MLDGFGSGLERELGSGEKLLWKGRPRGGVRLRASDLYLIPFSLLWGGFAIFWEYSVIVKIPKDEAVGWFFPLFGVPFVLFGLYFIFGRFLLDAKIRASSEYAVTNRRAIIVSGVFGRKVRSINIKSTPEITLAENADRSGTITFGPPLSGRAAQRGLLFPGTSAQPAFEMIDDVRTVYEIIDKAKQS